MTGFEYHVFFCVNQREDGSACCGAHGANAMRDYAKSRLKEMGLHGPGKVRINKAGCMGHCDQGPVLVVYPEGVWYTWVDEEDIDEIIDEHLLGGRVVERLKLDDGQD